MAAAAGGDGGVPLAWPGPGGLAGPPRGEADKIRIRACVCRALYAP